MKNIILLPALLLALTLSSCRKEPKGDLELQFKGLFDGQSLVMGDAYSYQNNPIKFLELRFFVADVTLLNNDEEIPVTDIALLDFTQNHSLISTATNGEKLQFVDLPAGEYTGIRFGIGVSAGMNSTTPDEYGSDSPLSNAGDYWEAWVSYIHAKIEGRVDTNNDGQYDLGFAYHMGMDEQYRTKEITQAISIPKNGTASFPMTVEMTALLDTLNIINMPISHTDPGVEGSLETSAYLMDNFVQAINPE